MQEHLISVYNPMYFIKYFYIREPIKSVIKILHANKVGVKGYQYKMNVPTLEFQFFGIFPQKPEKSPVTC